MHILVRALYVGVAVCFGACGDGEGPVDACPSGDARTLDAGPAGDARVDVGDSPDAAFGSTVPEFYWDYAFGIESACRGRAVLQRPSLPETGLFSRETYDLWLDNATDWTNEALLFAPRLSGAWSSQGPALYDTLIETTEIPLIRERISATIFVCLNENSNASPLSLSVPYFLPEAGRALGRTSAWENALQANEIALPLPLENFVEITFHELLHVYVSERLQERHSDLILEYAAEGPVVQSHLHVFALEKAVYERLGARDSTYVDTLNRSRRLYRAAGADGYSRAWEIVDERGSEPFIAELIAPIDRRRCSFCSARQWPSVAFLAHLYDLRF